MRAQLHASVCLTLLDMRMNGHYNSSGYVTGTHEMGTSSRNTELMDPRSKNAWLRQTFGIKW